MRFIDFFAGIGGFRLAFERAGHICVGHCEIDKFANDSYVAMHEPKEGEFYARDIRAIDPAELPEADIYTFGFPCQSFSIAGKRAGFKDMRGTLIFEILRLAKERHPKYLVGENVAGLLSHNNGQTFFSILTTLEKLGYHAEWSCINSKYYLPQNRERIYIIGHFGKRCGREIFPIRKSDEYFNTRNEQQTLTTEKRPLETGQGLTETVEKQSQVKQVGNILNDADKGFKNPHRGRVYDPCGISPSLNACGGGNLEPKVIIPILTPDKRITRQNGRRFKENGDPSFTLTAQDRHGVIIKEATSKGYAKAYKGDSINISMPNRKTRRGLVGKGVAQTLTTGCNQDTLDGLRIRKLTPKEFFRLQGFPDELFEKARKINSDHQLYKQAGNSVSVPVVYDIAKKITE